jgi:hypothetical protein
MNLNGLYNKLSGNPDFKEMLAVAQQMDAQSGTDVFTRTLAADPAGFQRNIMSKL